VKTILPAGAAIPLESERKLRENFPELTSVSSLYGTSEIGIIARTDTNHHIGYLMPLVEVKVCLKQYFIFIQCHLNIKFGETSARAPNKTGSKILYLF